MSSNSNSINTCMDANKPSKRARVWEIQSQSVDNNSTSVVIPDGSFCRDCYKPVAPQDNCSHCNGRHDLIWASKPENSPINFG